MILNKKTFVNSLRMASPYIISYQSKQFLLIIDLEDFSEEVLQQFIEDLIWLQRIGVRLILVPQYKNNINSTNLTVSLAHKDKLKKLNNHFWEFFKSQWFKLSGKKNIIQADLIKVKPQGVVAGKDMQFSGLIEDYFNLELMSLLDNDWLVWSSPFGLSNLGVEYLVNSKELVLKIISNCQCNKVLYLSQENIPSADSNHLSVYEAKQLKSDSNQLDLVIKSCQLGVDRAHILDISENGNLLTELFTPDGCGLLIHNDNYDTLGIADKHSVAGIYSLIEKLEKQGQLVARSIDQIDENINDFYVMRRDGEVIACVALHELENENREQSAEIACLAVHSTYQSQGFASQLMDLVMKEANKKNINQLFVLTTSAQSWFEKYGFKVSNWLELPESRRERYNHDRNSFVLKRKL